MPYYGCDECGMEHNIYIKLTLIFITFQWFQLFYFLIMKKSNIILRGNNTQSEILKIIISMAQLVYLFTIQVKNSNKNYLNVNLK